nr:retrovirus-related Pol polyprotein from transposon TNT 1-94 [Tanacetum cinerariifolium]
RRLYKPHRGGGGHSAIHSQPRRRQRQRLERLLPLLWCRRWWLALVVAVTVAASDAALVVFGGVGGGSSDGWWQRGSGEVVAAVVVAARVGGVRLLPWQRLVVVLYVGKARDGKWDEGSGRSENDHVAAILGFGQFCDSDLEVAFRRNACFVRNLEGVDLLKGDRSTNLYTINLHEMASASPICLMARASSTKSWLWHQRLSHLNFDTINDLARDDLVAGLPKFKYHKEHLCPSCEQGKSKRASHLPKPVLNSRQRLHLLYINLCRPMRIASINGKRALCYPKNDREDIGKLGAKGDIGFFIDILLIPVLTEFTIVYAGYPGWDGAWISKDMDSVNL